MIMKEFVSRIDEETGEPIVSVFSSVDRFSYKCGYHLEGIDLGFTHGVKLTLSHPQYDNATIMLSPEIVDKLAYWLLKSMAQKVPRLPNKLAIVLRRIIDEKGFVIKLKKGDKKVVKDALAVMADVLYHEEIKEARDGKANNREPAAQNT